MRPVVVFVALLAIGRCIQIDLNTEKTEIPNVLGTPQPPTETTVLYVLNALTPGFNATAAEGIVLRTASLSVSGEAQDEVTALPYGQMARIEVLLDQNSELGVFAHADNVVDSIFFERVVGDALPAAATGILVLYKDQTKGTVSAEGPTFVGPDEDVFELALNVQPIPRPDLEEYDPLAEPTPVPTTGTVYLLNAIVGLDTRVDAFVVDVDYFSYRVLQNLDPGYLQRFTLQAGRTYRLKVFPTGTVDSIEAFEATQSIVEVGEIQFSLAAGGHYFGALFGWFKVKIDIDPTAAALFLAQNGFPLVDERPQYAIQLSTMPALLPPVDAGRRLAEHHVDTSSGLGPVWAWVASLAAGGGVLVVLWAWRR